MEKLLIGAIAVLILLAFTPIKSATFNVANLTSVTTAINQDAEEPQVLLIRSDEVYDSVDSEISQAEYNETGIEAIETKQETGDSDRVVFISIGSLLLIGIILLLPL
jgi:spermidine/putrescine-binding protein